MNFDWLLAELITDTTSKSLVRFVPELILCGTVVLLLFVRLFNADRVMPTCWVAMGGSILAFAWAFFQFVQLNSAETLPTAETLFTGLLLYDLFTVFLKVFLLLFLILVIALTILSGIPDMEDGPDFYTLLLGSTIGMMMMAAANHLLILFLAVEMASVPSYVMVGFLKGRRQSSEAALKYVVYGAGAAGVMLYGISLLAGLLGTAEMPAIASQINALIADNAGMSDPSVRTIVMATMMVFVGLAFKLSVVPFHFWCPDAFEGAAAEVGGYLSVASKAAAFALLVRFCLSLVGDSAAITSVYLNLGIGIGVIAAVTATFGNLSAYAQTNVKRLLAYSTIAHAGYMLMAVSAMMVLLAAPDSVEIDSQGAAEGCLEGLLFYLAVYLFMNLGAFAIVALIRNEIYSEEIVDYNGLIHQTPVLCTCMAICFFSLIGLPPMGGFVGKFMIFASLVEAAKVHWFMWVVLVLGGINTVLSLFYYLRVLKAMILAERPDGARSAEISASSPSGMYVVIVSIPILVLGMTPMIGMLSRTVRSAAAILF